MSVWDSYPVSYRSVEVQAILAALRAGECAAVIGLSGSGKSNLLGFLAQRVLEPELGWALVDCNRLEGETAGDFFDLARRALGEAGGAGSAGFPGLEKAVASRLAAGPGRLCLLFDRFDAVPAAWVPSIAGNLRALRDAHKYELTFAIAARPGWYEAGPLGAHSELAELFYAHTLWLGPLSASDARWSAASYARRRGLEWDDATLDRLIALTGGYPAWLRAACEAAAGGAECTLAGLGSHAAVRRRLEEFWADRPTPESLARSRLTGIPLLGEAGLSPAPAETEHLTAKEQLLLEYFQAQPGRVCAKDDLIRAVWPEDRVFQKGVRDDSLAQLVRRLREKIENDPSAPRKIQTVPGRGYRFTGNTAA